MVKQLNLLGTGQIIPTALHLEMERSYLEYAMSVIVGRALPDIRDGLKPVHRRILYAMYELGLTPDRPYRKCARVVGDVLGKYHPHGDQSVYDALVRMVQDFSSRYPLLSGHGNFGSVDNDPAAAMRYTETRLSSLAHATMLSEISEATVSFTSNFDNSQQEPVVLPAQLPILLLNGCSGIAVGMATNIPPHNLGEVVDGLIALIDNPQLEDEKLWQLIPGPDFPTGGEIIDTNGIKEAYRTGRGTIPIRGIAELEQIDFGKKRNREKTAIVITELPYQVSKAGWIEKVAELVNQGRLEGIADIRDESDRTGMRVVIEVKKDVSIPSILEQLYHQTPLQTNFGVITLALVNNKPCQLSLRQLLDEFLTFREQTLTKQYNYELQESTKRLHTLSGLLTALEDLDRVIEILKNAPDGSSAKIMLGEQLGITEIQADAILAMPLRRLTGLERKKIQTESEELQTSISQLEKLLGDRVELMKALKKDLRSFKRQFDNPRRTRIIKAQKNAPKSSQVEAKEIVVNTQATTLPEDALIEVTHNEYIYWNNEPKSSNKISEDFIVYREKTETKKELVIVNTEGKAYPLNIQDIPSFADKKKKSLINLLPGRNKESSIIVNQFLLPEELDKQDLLLLTGKGRIKRSPLTELSELGNRGLMLMKLKEDDCLRYVCLTAENQDLLIATSTGRVLRFKVVEQSLPMMSRAAMGNQVLHLRPQEKLVGCLSLKTNHNLLLVSQLGYAKRMPISALRLGSLGDIGSMAMQFTMAEDHLISMVLASSPKVVLLTNTKRRIALGVNSIPLWGKDGTGEKVANLKAEEKIIAVVNCY